MLSRARPAIITGNERGESVDELKCLSRHSFPPPRSAELHFRSQLRGRGLLTYPPPHGVTDRRNCRGEKRWRALYFLPRTVRSIIDFTPDCRVRGDVSVGGGEGRVRFLPTLDGLGRRSITGGPVCVDVVAESIIWSHLNEVELLVLVAPASMTHHAAATGASVDEYITRLTSI